MEAHRSISAPTDFERALTATPSPSTVFAPVDTSARATSRRNAIPRTSIRATRVTRKGFPDEPEAVASVTIFDCINVPERRL